MKDIFTLDIEGSVKDQISICLPLVDSLDEDEFVIGLSKKGQTNKNELEKYLVKSNLLEKLIPGYFYSYRVKKDEIKTFLNLLSLNTDSIFITVDGDNIYRSFGNDDICLFPRSQIEADILIAVLEKLKRERLIENFVISKD